MKRQLDVVLDECLALLAQGESLESCLARYPEYAAELTLLLSLARDIETLRPAEPLSAAAVEAQKQRFLDKARRLRQEKAKAPFFGWLNWGRLALPARMALATAAVLALAVLVGGGVVLASGQDLGDVVINLMPQPVRDFFGIETVPEMTPTPELEEEDAEEGENEEQEDEGPGDDEEEDGEDSGEDANDEEDFEGSVEEIGEGFFVVSGITFFLDSDTEVEDTLEVGLMVRVRYVVQEDGSFLVTRIEVREGED